MREHYMTGPGLRAEDGSNLVITGIAIVFWAAIILGAVMLIAWFVRKQNADHINSAAAANDPLTIAKLRYARGEITKDEFATLKKDLLADK